MPYYGYVTKLINNLAGNCFRLFNMAPSKTFKENWKNIYYLFSSSIIMAFVSIQDFYYKNALIFLVVTSVKHFKFRVS